MLKYFKCPDGQTVDIKECLEKCRLHDRCLSLPTLNALGWVKEWKGKPSTTQCLNPTRMEYLKIKHEYFIDPFSMAFALLGTRHHGMLDMVAKKLEGVTSELFMKNAEITGIVDLLEPINGTEAYRLIDYKTYGSFAVAKLLSDTNGKHEREALALQMNNYRLLAQSIGFDVKELKCQVTVRDGGTQSARNNGIAFNIKMIDVPIMDDDDVIDYFMFKANALIEAVNNGIMPKLCDYDERWGGRRCKGYCDVFMHCPEGAKVNKVDLVS